VAAILSPCRPPFELCAPSQLPCRVQVVDLRARWPLSCPPSSLFRTLRPLPAALRWPARVSYGQMAAILCSCRPPFAVCTPFLGRSGDQVAAILPPPSCLAMARWRILGPSPCRSHFALCALSQTACAGAISFLGPGGRYLVPLSSPFRTPHPVLRARWPLSCHPVVPLSHSAPRS